VISWLQTAMLTGLISSFKAPRDLRELEKLRWIAQTINQHLQSLTLFKVGSRIQRTLEDETKEVDLTEIDISMNRMTLRATGELARKYMRLADGFEKTEEEIASVIAMCILSSWLRCKIIARRSLNKKVVNEAREIEGVYFSYMQNFLRGVRGEPFDTVRHGASDTER
jgi:hypothetical protein